MLNHSLLLNPPVPPASLSRPARLYHGALDALFPPRCTGCGRWGCELWCEPCGQNLLLPDEPWCESCGEPFDPRARALSICKRCREAARRARPGWQVARSVWLFEGPLRQSVHLLKYRGRTALAGPLGAQLATALRHGLLPLEINEISALVPVPLHPWRRYRRGYNQSELLARAAARRLDRPCSLLLRRTRLTPPQVGLDIEERTRNVRNAFALDAKALERWQQEGGDLSHPVVIIDDVFTTGSTLRECAAELGKAGFEQVYALTLARQM